MPRINPEIYREYDIRGVVGDDIDAQVFETIGKAYGAYMRERGAKRISLGRDCRLSSPELAGAVRSGINSTGVDVIDIGMVSTPMLYFSLYNLDVQGGRLYLVLEDPDGKIGILVLDEATGRVIGDIRLLPGTATR